MRMQIRRFTRQANAFREKWENHYAALSLYFVSYNFVRVHITIRVTPAMEAGITDQVDDRGKAAQNCLALAIGSPFF
jgi:hypothetical protein